MQAPPALEMTNDQAEPSAVRSSSCFESKLDFSPIPARGGIDSKTNNNSSCCRSSSSSSGGNNNNINNIKKKKKSSKTVVAVVQLEPNDILSGRGRLAWNHVGNQQFRQFISQNVDKYIEARTGIEKTGFIISLVNTLRNDMGARFLKQTRTSTTTNGYQLLNRRGAHEKVGHALRDATKARGVVVVANKPQLHSSSSSSSSFSFSPFCLEDSSSPQEIMSSSSGPTSTTECYGGGEMSLFPPPPPMNNNNQFSLNTTTEVSSEMKRPPVVPQQQQQQSIASLCEQYHNGMFGGEQDSSRFNHCFTSQESNEFGSTITPTTTENEEILKRSLEKLIESLDDDDDITTTTIDDCYYEGQNNNALSSLSSFDPIPLPWATNIPCCRPNNIVP